MERRDFIKKTGKAVALAAVTGGTGYLFHNREIAAGEETLAGNLDFLVPPDSGLPIMTLNKNEDNIMALRATLDAIGGIKRFVKVGERVTIKPNVGWDRTPAQAANTNPDLVAEMVRQCLEAGAGEVIVTDVTCNDARRTFLRSGIKEAAEQAGAKVYLPGENDYIEADLKGELLTSWPVLKYFIETDRLINMPIVKHHSLSGCTVGMKNLYGILGGPRYQLHQSIDQSIVDLTRFATPTLTVIDGTRVLLRSGPQGGSLDDVAIKHTVMCTTDPVAGDARASEMLGLSPDKIGHIMLAEKSGLGSADYKNAGFKEII